MVIIYARVVCFVTDKRLSATWLHPRVYQLYEKDRFCEILLLNIRYLTMGIVPSEEEKLENLRALIRDNDNIVAMLGTGMEIECGLKNLWSSEECYRIEDEYGLSPEELFSAAFYTTKKQKFYKFYRREILDSEAHPGPGYYAVKKLEDMGKLSACIVHDISGLAEEAGIKNIINIRGSIRTNECPKCYKKYSLNYMKRSKGIPLCEKCQVPIRPRVLLRGEMMRNDVMTKAADAVRDASLVLILGTNMNHPIVRTFLQYYEGEHVILITLHNHFSDSLAEMCIHGKVDEILPKAIR
ncbi:MAG: hypothetical protein K5770_18440 [Lachnospiraceae bacterium]|nr:hypothetical protein [Lachnospiraceae bacterium]